MHMYHYEQYKLDWDTSDTFTTTTTTTITTTTTMKTHSKQLKTSTFIFPPSLSSMRAYLDELSADQPIVTHLCVITVSVVNRQ